MCPGNPAGLVLAELSELSREGAKPCSSPVLPPWGRDMCLVFEPAQTIAYLLIQQRMQELFRWGEHWPSLKVQEPHLLLWQSPGTSPLQPGGWGRCTGAIKQQEFVLLCDRNIPINKWFRWNWADNWSRALQETESHWALLLHGLPGPQWHRGLGCALWPCQPLHCLMGEGAWSH